MCSSQVIAEETKEIVEREEFEAARKAVETQSMAADAQKDLGKFELIKHVMFYYLREFSFQRKLCRRF